MPIARTSQIVFHVHLDEKAVPERLEWEAADSDEPGTHPCKALLLSIWDADKSQALRIDLWTKDMPVPDMNDFFFQTLHTMADTYLNATGNAEAAKVLKTMSEDFAAKARAEG